MTDLLVDAKTLAAELTGPRPPVVLDVRWSLTGPPGVAAYRAGHVPGAVFVDLDRELSGRRGAAGRHPLPAAADFEAAMRRCGVSSTSRVVVYDAADCSSAARAWWNLRYFGHENVRALDGGYAAWLRAGQAVSTDEPDVAPGDFVATPGHLPLVDADEAALLARSGVLLDVRAPERYRGEVEPVDPVAGHVPGATSLPTSGNVDPSGTFLDVEILRRRFAEAGLGGDVNVAAYCGSGVNAAHTVLAVMLAGLPAPALYVGSWSNWVADPSRPVAIGEA